jgi:hypothetical protein
MADEVKRGRPRKGEQREALRIINFRVDEETFMDLEALEKTVGPNVRGRRSILLRRLIRTAVGKES